MTKGPMGIVVILISSSDDDKLNRPLNFFFISKYAGSEDPNIRELKQRTFFHDGGLHSVREMDREWRLWRENF